MSNAKWHKGPPPSIGWWQASLMEDPVALRWWDGKYWSWPVWSDMKYTEAQLNARISQRRGEVMGQKNIKWKDRPDSWPARSKT